MSDEQNGTLLKTTPVMLNRWLSHLELLSEQFSKHHDGGYLILL